MNINNNLPIAIGVRIVVVGVGLLMIGLSAGIVGLLGCALGYHLWRRNDRVSKKLLNLGFDFSSSVLSLYLSLAFSLTEVGDSTQTVLVACFLIVVVGGFFLRFYNLVLRFSLSELHKRLFFLNCFLALCAGVCFEILENSGPPSVFYVSFFLMSFSFMYFGRVVFVDLLNRWGITPKENILIEGINDDALKLAKILQNSRTYRVLGFIDDGDSAGVEIGGVKVFSVESIYKNFVGFGINKIVLSSNDKKSSVHQRLLEICVDLGLEAVSFPDLGSIVLDKPYTEQVLGELTLEDLLDRPLVPPLVDLLQRNIENKTVLITGAGGSIGRELCKVAIAQRPRALLLLDSSEFALYNLLEDLGEYSDGVFSPILMSITDLEGLTRVFDSNQIDTIYHAAAYKHVPIVEINPFSGIYNNVKGTEHLADLAVLHGVKNFTLISSDKAVRPTNIMGASKRLSELICMEKSMQTNHSCIFSMVRFGNVMGSSGSVIPKFRKQIEQGGPVTVTHKDITRYFMSIREASELVIQASSMASGGEVFVLDMGEAIRISDLAEKMVRLSGARIKSDEGSILSDVIEIEYVGLRDGEKMHEELFVDANVIATGHPKILQAQAEELKSADLAGLLAEVFDACTELNLRKLKQNLASEYVQYSGENNTGGDIFASVYQDL